MKDYKKTHSLSFPKINFKMTLGKGAIIGLIICLIPTIILCIPSLLELPNFNFEPLIWMFYIVGGIMCVGCGVAWFVNYSMKEW